LLFVGQAIEEGPDVHLVVAVSIHTYPKMYLPPELTFFAWCYSSHDIGTILQAILSISSSNSPSESLLGRRVLDLR
jgi:hypothetical protein